MTVRPLFFLALLATPALAQDGGKPLNVGDAIPGPFRVFVTSDDRFDSKSPNVRTGKMHCFICEAELNPTVAVFSRSVPTAESPVIKVAATLNELVTAYRSDRFGAFVAFLTLAKDYPEEEGRDEKANKVKDVAAQAKTTGVPYGVAAGKSAATDLYGLQESDDITIIFFDRMKVIYKKTFTADKPPTADDLKALTDEVKKQLKK